MSAAIRSEESPRYAVTANEVERENAIIAQAEAILY